jgi:hypothetical protein
MKGYGFEEIELNGDTISISISIAISIIDGHYALVAT